MKQIPRRVWPNLGLIAGVVCALLTSGCASQKVRCNGKLEPINRAVPSSAVNGEKSQ